MRSSGDVVGKIRQNGPSEEREWPGGHLVLLTLNLQMISFCYQKEIK